MSRLDTQHTIKSLKTPKLNHFPSNFEYMMPKFDGVNISFFKDPSDGKYKFVTKGDRNLGIDRTGAILSLGYSLSNLIDYHKKNNLRSSVFELITPHIDDQQSRVIATNYLTPNPKTAKHAPYFNQLELIHLYGIDEDFNLKVVETPYNTIKYTNDVVNRISNFKNILYPQDGVIFYNTNKDDSYYKDSHNKRFHRDIAALKFFEILRLKVTKAETLVAKSGRETKMAHFDDIKMYGITYSKCVLKPDSCHTRNSEIFVKFMSGSAPIHMPDDCVDPFIFSHDSIYHF